MGSSEIYDVRTLRAIATCVRTTARCELTTHIAHEPCNRKGGLMQGPLEGYARDLAAEFFGGDSADDVALARQLTHLISSIRHEKICSYTFEIDEQLVSVLVFEAASS